MLHERTCVLEDQDRALFIVAFKRVHRVIAPSVLNEMQMGARVCRQLLFLPTVDLASNIAKPALDGVKYTFPILSRWHFEMLGKRV